MEKRFNLGKPFVIADSGMLLKKNITSSEEDGYEGILGARSKIETEKMKQEILALDL